mmetsp:Transcript_94471/g.270925  ORF Transcript_94471/g.270925 Transcript_94471/m.270925 type:complete len:245 (+) Transcript_94471:573-1307(+)
MLGEGPAARIHGPHRVVPVACVSHQACLRNRCRRRRHGLGFHLLHPARTMGPRRAGGGEFASRVERSSCRVRLGAGRARYRSDPQLVGRGCRHRGLERLHLQTVKPGRARRLRAAPSDDDGDDGEGRERLARGGEGGARERECGRVGRGCLGLGRWPRGRSSHGRGAVLTEQSLEIGGARACGPRWWRAGGRLAAIVRGRRSSRAPPSDARARRRGLGRRRRRPALRGRSHRAERLAALVAVVV